MVGTAAGVVVNKGFQACLAAELSVLWPVIGSAAVLIAPVECSVFSTPKTETGASYDSFKVNDQLRILL